MQTLSSLARPLLAVLSALVMAACAAPSGVASKSEVNALVARAHEQIETGDLAGAEKTLLAARWEDADNALVALDLGVVYQRTGRKEAAQAEYRKVLAADEEAVNAGKSPLYGTWRNRLSTIARSNLRTLESVAPIAPAASQSSAVGK